MWQEFSDSEAHKSDLVNKKVKVIVVWPSAARRTFSIFVNVEIMTLRRLC
jgi:hypothetical protein